MRRKLWAFLAYNLYFFIIVTAFAKETPYLFSAIQTDKIFVSPEALLPDVANGWAWGPHYIWRLFSGSLATFLAAALAGAIAKNKGSLVAVVSAIPSVIMLGVLIWLLSSGQLVASESGKHIICSYIMIITTFVIAFFGGRFGQNLQANEFTENTVLGLKGYHWAALCIPIYIYAMGLVFVVYRFVTVYFHSPTSIVGFLWTVIFAIPVIAWCIPLWLTYCILTRTIWRDKGRFARVASVGFVLLVGVFAATGVQFGVYYAVKAIVL